MIWPVLLSIPSPDDPVAFAIGGLEIRWYALFILSGIVAAIALCLRLAQSKGYDTEVAYDMAPWVVFLSIAGARFYFVLLEWDDFKDDLGGALNFRSGGLSIHGAIIVGILVVLVYTRIRRQPFFGWGDVILPGVALGQAIGRWGNWVNQEAFGTPSSLPWAVEIEPDRRPDKYIAESSFHPAFLYESIFDLLNAAILAWLVFNRNRVRWLRTGDVAGLYMINYGLIRFFIERIRTDSLYIGPLPAAYWLSFALIGGGVLIMIGIRLQPARPHD